MSLSEPTNCRTWQYTIRILNGRDTCTKRYPIDMVIDFKTAVEMIRSWNRRCKDVRFSLVIPITSP